MYLDRLALAGYCSYGGSLADNEIKLRQMNLIIGANGAGKSNLISFLEMIAFMMTRGFRLYVARRGGAKSLFHFGLKHTDQIDGKLTLCANDNDDGIRDVYAFSLEANDSDQLFFTREFMSYHTENHKIPYERDFGVGHDESRMVDDTDSPVVVLCRSLKALRVFHFEDTSRSSRIRRGGEIADNAYLRSDAGNLAAFLYRIKRDNLKYYRRILRYIRLVLPQFDDFYLESDDDRYISLRWQIVGEEGVMGAHQLSDGTLRFIALTTLLLQPPDRAPSTIILDEPEIGLHPYALSILAQEMRLAQKTSQVIVSTQSPLLLDNFSCEDVIVAEYDTNTQRSRLRRYEEHELKEWLENYSLSDLWLKNVIGGTPL